MRWTFSECNKSPAKNERHVFICGSSVQRFRNRMIYNGITAAVKRLWHCFFITTTDVFSYLRVQNQIFSGLLNPDCSDEANDVPHLLTEKKHTDDFLLVIFLFWVQKEGETSGVWEFNSYWYGQRAQHPQLVLIVDFCVLLPTAWWLHTACSHE